MKPTTAAKPVTAAKRPTDPEANPTTGGPSPR
jgi:hypothetical protein